jgi:BirA family biotin operon repressor/biotin-[acetyl-CoA-carboxylase] ligase
VALERHPVLGFRLLEVPDRPLPEEVEWERQTRFVGARVHCLAQTGSTNDVALRLLAEGAPEGTLVIAEQQSGGRGRRGRRWESPPGVGLWCTLLLSPPAGTSPGFLTQLLGASLARALRGESGVPLRLSWPNDLVIAAGGESRKVGGILCEIPRGGAAAGPLAAGFGIDVNQERFDGDLVRVATSLRRVRGRSLSRSALLKAILREIERDWDAATRGGTGLVLDQVRRLSATLHGRVRLRLERGILEGTAIDIEEDGALCVCDDEGTRHVVRSGDVERAGHATPSS